MEEAVVLFGQYRNDAATQQHLELLRTHNEYPIVPLFCDDGLGGVPLPDSVQLPMTYQRGRNWHNVDWLLRDWFRSKHRIDAKRYLWLEWDCHVNMPLKDWYGAHWLEDLVGTTAVYPESKWYWFRTQRAFLPHALYCHAARHSSLQWHPALPPCSEHIRQRRASRRCVL